MIFCYVSIILPLHMHFVGVLVQQKVCRRFNGVKMMKINSFFDTFVSFYKRQLPCASSLVFSLYKLWLRVYGEPDETEIIIFNEQPHRCPLRHSDFQCPKRYCQQCRVMRIIKYLEKATVSIDIAMFTISCQLFYQAIAGARSRGVIVRCLTDSQMVYVTGSRVKHLMDIGVSLRCSPVNLIMHHKFCIIDGEERLLQLDGVEHRIPMRLWQRKGYVVTGSLNWTTTGTASNFENVVVSSNREINSLYQKLFDNMWEKFPLLGKASFRMDSEECEEDENVCLPWKFWEGHIRQKS